MSRLTLIAAMAALSSAAYAADTHTHWGYTGHSSPESWGSLDPKFQVCSSGKNQSPINISETVSGQLHDLKADYRAAPVEVTNNGHTIQVNYADGSNTLSLGNEKYTLKQFHFHVPSENQIKGKSFPMEVHFVHSNEQGQLLVLARLYEAGKDNGRLAPVWKVMPKKADQSIKLAQPFDAAVLLPETLGYYRFTGSLTTPPCSEGVIWLVLKNHDQIGKAQTKQFAKALRTHNNRPVQPLNARVVVE